MKRILFFIPRFASGGAEAFIVNVAELLSVRGYACSIISIDSRDSIYDSRLVQAGIAREVLVSEKCGSLFELYRKAYSAFQACLSKHSDNIDVVHFNIAQGEELPFIFAAKKAGIPSRILHSHNSQANSFVKVAGHRICKVLFSDVATEYLACSDKAAEWLMPQKVLTSLDYKIINNGIHLNQFEYNPDVRHRTRNELEINAKHCYVSIGRLDEQKNHSFLLDAYKELVKLDPDSVLLCLGEGHLRGSLEAKARDLGVSEQVRWLGLQNDILNILCAADCFVMPSLFEGFPFSLIEAQTSGLPCAVSDRVSRKCALTDLVSFLPLDSIEFARSTYKLVIDNENSNRSSYRSEVEKKGYGIESTVNNLIEIYEQGSI